MDDLSPNLRLETFWNCLDERQKHDLKHIKGDTLVDKQCCKYCQDLLLSSMHSVEKDASIAWHKVTKAHKEYLKLDESYFKSILTEKGVLVDIKGIFKNSISDIEYWTL